MFGKSEDSKELKSAVSSVGCDGTDFREWLKQYEKVKKQYPAVTAEYRRAKQNALGVQNSLRQMEEILKEQKKDDISRKEFSEGLKELKRVKDTLGHEFLISKADKEFFSTYETILRLGAAYQNGKGNPLILQSEVENLLALLAENLAKEEPDLLPLTFFYLGHRDEELVELPAAERLKRLMETYDTEYIRPIRKILMEAIECADEKGAALEAEDGRKAIKQLQELALLRETAGGTIEERADTVIAHLCRM